jgi:hypothetical protein
LAPHEKETIQKVCSNMKEQILAYPSPSRHRE